MNRKVQEAVHGARSKVAGIQLQLDLDKSGVQQLDREELQAVVAELNTELNFIWGRCMRCLGRREFECRINEDRSEL